MCMLKTWFISVIVNLKTDSVVRLFFPHGVISTIQYKIAYLLFSKRSSIVICSAKIRLASRYRIFDN